jgi:Holliday junction resolvase RusA-like endonuclease
VTYQKFEFTVFDRPTPAHRPRFTKTGRIYNPQVNLDARNYIRAGFLELPQVVQQVFADSWVPITGPIKLTVKAYVPMPKSIPKKRQKQARPITRPDLDNYIKQVEDALNGYAWKDDAQVVAIEAHKIYAWAVGLGHVQPRWVITIEEIGV